MKIKGTLEQYESFIQQKNNLIEEDFNKLREIFTKMENQASGYLIQHLQIDCKKMFEIYAK